MVWDPEDDVVVEPAIELPGEVGASWYPDADALLMWHDHRGRVELRLHLPLDGALGARDRSAAD